MAGHSLHSIWLTLGALAGGSLITYGTMRLCDNTAMPQKPKLADTLAGGDFASWTHDWDNRAPKRQLVNTESAGDEPRSVALRHIVLVRHGEYINYNDGSHHLTERGREQAQHTGERLRAMNVPWDHVVASTMTRAQETAMIVLKHINFDPLKMKRCALLPEGTPCPADPPQGRSFGRVQQAYRRDGPRIEAAFRRYFFRASPDQKNDSYLLIIGHANVIRYLVCRALQLPAAAWTRISLNHGSITWLTVYPSGYVTIKCLGDSGFMPVGQLTHRRPRLQPDQPIAN